jgi:hypothetical protein
MDQSIRDLRSQKFEEKRYIVGERKALPQAMVNMTACHSCSSRSTNIDLMSRVMESSRMDLLNE